MPANVKHSEYIFGHNCPECGEIMGSSNCSCFEECADCGNPEIACECEEASA